MNNCLQNFLILFMFIILLFIITDYVNSKLLIIYPDEDNKKTNEYVEKDKNVTIIEENNFNYNKKLDNDYKPYDSNDNYPTMIFP